MILRSSHRILAGLLGLLALSAAALAAPPDRYVITDFGAVSGGPVGTRAIQAAIDRCHEAGGGVVVVPPGRFVTGTLILRSHVRLEVDSGGLLLGSPDLKDYPVLPTPSYRSLKDQNGFRCLIYAENQENIGLGGDGTIDGQGASFKWGGSDMDSRPRLILFISCRDVRVENLRLRNSGMWMEHYLNCEDVQIRGLRVWNHANVNNDMLDLDGCRRVTVSDCIGDTEDDGLTIKSTGPAPCQDVSISNCVISSYASAIKCGTESTGGFRNITISNITVKPSADLDQKSGNPHSGGSGISLETVDGGVMDGVAISNINIRGTLAPIFIRLGNRARKYNPAAPAPPVASLGNIRISNLIARDVGGIGCSITGIPGHPVENIWLSGITIDLGQAGAAGDVSRDMPELEATYPSERMWGGRLPAYGFFVRHARNVHFEDVTVVPAPGEPRPALVSRNVEGLQVDHCTFSAPAP